MGTYEFRLPDIGEGVVEGEIVSWHVSEGDVVKEDAPLLEVMTDKASVVIPSPVDGKITATTGKPGEIIPVGQVCIVFEIDGEGNASAETPPKVDSVEIPPEPTPEPAPVTPSTNTQKKTEGGKSLASPAVRQRARKAGIDLSTVSGSGRAGRISNSDLDAHISSGGTGPTLPSTPATPRGIALTGVDEVPVIGLRRKIAEKMVESKTNIPHFSYFEDVDVTELESLRQYLNSTRADGQPKLTYLPFIMLALAKLMPHHPECNGIYDEEAGKVLRHHAIHLGIATQTEKGLYVPVVKHVESMDIWAAAAEMQRVTGAARDGTAALDELNGSTFTITSLGRDGGLGATPIINHPEMAILGVHKATERPVVINGRIEIRRIMNLSSSFDHRVIDGAEGAALVQHLKRMLEHPAMIFM